MRNHFESVDNDRCVSGSARPVWHGLTLLLILLLAAVALGRLVPSVPAGISGPKVRLAWYFRSGQWQADVRTLAAVFQYIMDDDSSPPLNTNAPTNWIAALEAAAGSSRSDGVCAEANSSGLSVASESKSLCAMTSASETCNVQATSSLLTAKPSSPIDTPTSPNVIVAWLRLSGYLLQNLRDVERLPPECINALHAKKGEFVRGLTMRIGEISKKVR